MTHPLETALRLSGVVLILLGLALRLRVTLVVVTGALCTGLFAGLPLFSDASAGAPVGIVNMLGRAFRENRFLTVFLLTLPVIGVCESFGLQRESARLMQRFAAATPGRLLTLYQLLRVLSGMLGFRLNGHPLFVRPLIVPMVQRASEHSAASPDGEQLKAAAAAAENYGNFYGQNLSPVQAGVLLVYAVMTQLHYVLTLGELVFYTLPVVAASLLLGALQFHWLDRRLRRARTGAA
ncbi:MAG: DUF969 family protein [Polyangiales bacterium]